MEKLELNVLVREETGKGVARKLRRSGRVPAVFYGPKAVPLSLSVDSLDVKSIIESDSGINTLITLKVDGNKDLDGKIVMIKELQTHPLANDFLHADFLEVDLTKKIQVDVAVILIGSPVGLAEGGILEQPRREVLVECTPTNIPQQIEADVSEMNIGDTLHIEDLKVGDEIRILGDPMEAIASLTLPAIEEEPVEEELEGEAEEGAEGAEEKEGDSEEKPAKEEETQD